MAEPLNSGIYRLDFPDGRFYIGSSCKLRQRIQNHKSYLRRGMHGNSLLQRAWNNYQSVISRIILYCRDEDLLFYEQCFLDEWRPGMNLSPIAGRIFFTDEIKAKISNGNYGKKRTQEMRSLLSERQKQLWADPEVRARRVASHINRKKVKRTDIQSEEQRSRQSAFMKGNKLCAGIKLSAEHKQKISNGLKNNKNALGLVHTKETKQKISRSLIGNRHAAQGINNVTH